MKTSDVKFKINYLGSYEGEGLAAHNKYRKIHNAKPMRLDRSLTQQARAYAQRLARTGTFQHSSSNERPGQGENLAMACGSGGLSARRAVEMWWVALCYKQYSPKRGWKVIPHLNHDLILLKLILNHLQFHLLESRNSQYCTERRLCSMRKAQGPNVTDMDN